MAIKRSDIEIRQQHDLAVEMVNNGQSVYVDHSFEEGVLATLDWLLGITADVPIDPFDAQSTISGDDSAIGDEG